MELNRRNLFSTLAAALGACFAGKSVKAEPKLRERIDWPKPSRVWEFGTMLPNKPAEYMTRKELRDYADDNPTLRATIERTKEAVVRLLPGFDPEWVRAIIEDMLVLGDAYYLNTTQRTVLDAAHVFLLVGSDDPLRVSDPLSPVRISGYTLAVKGEITKHFDRSEVIRIKYRGYGRVYGRGLAESVAADNSHYISNILGSDKHAMSLAEMITHSKPQSPTADPVPLGETYHIHCTGQDLGVSYADGRPLLRVESDPVPGQYTASIYVKELAAGSKLVMCCGDRLTDAPVIWTIRYRFHHSEIGSRVMIPATRVHEDPVVIEHVISNPLPKPRAYSYPFTA